MPATWKRTAWLLVAAVVMVTGLLSTAGAQPALLRVDNEYIEIVVNDGDDAMGRFAVNTTGGDPVRVTDARSPLIYGSPDAGPWASYTTVRVDGEDWVFGGRSGRRAGRGATYGTQIQAPEVVGDEIRAVWAHNDVEVTQILSITRSITTALPDTARIEYRVRNTGDTSRRVGVRAVLDTMVGRNDGAPFRVGEEALTTDTVYRGANIPDFYQAFDSLAEPEVMSQGTLRGGGATTPDALYFTNWGSLADGIWDFDFEPGRDYTRLGEFDLDSAVALYWEPASLGPGDERSYVTFYGLGGVTIVPGHLSLGVTSPANVAAAEDDPPRFPVIAYIQNTGEGEARNVEASIHLPPGLALASGESARRDLGDLPVGGEAQAAWQVVGAPGATGDFTYRVRVESINSDPNQVDRTVHIVPPAQLTSTLGGPPRLDIVDERWNPVPLRLQGEIENTGGTAGHNVRAKLEMPIGLALARGETAMKYVGTLPPGERATLDWQVVPTGVTGNLPSSLRVESTDARIGSTPTHFVDVPRLDARLVVRVRGAGSGTPTVQVGDTFAVEVTAVNIPGLQTAALALHFDPEILQIPRSRFLDRDLGVERGDLFVAGTADSEAGYTPGEKLLWVDVPEIDNQAGVVRLAGGREPLGPLARANGTVATVRFRAVAPGESRLRLDWWLGNPYLNDNGQMPIEAFVVDEEGNTIHLSKQDAFVRVVSGP